MNVHLIDLAHAHQAELRRSGVRHITRQAALSARKNRLTVCAGNGADSTDQHS